MYRKLGRLVLHKHPDVDGDVVRTLVIHLLAYFPELVFTPTSPDELRLQASPGDHPMVVHVVTGSAASLERTISISVTVGGPVLDMTVASRLAAITTLNEYGGTEAHIHSIQPHPRLNRLVCLWKKKRKWMKPRHEYKSAVRSAIIGRGRTKVADRAAQWAPDQGQIAKTIAHVSWNDIRRITGATGWGEQFFYRLKLRAFKWWDVHRRVPGCPVEECLQTSITSAHTFWHCPSAVSLWTVFYSPWVALGMEISEQRIHATFGLKLVYVPVGIWVFLDELHRQDTEETHDKVRGQVHQLLQWCWALGVVTTLQAIWRRRCLYRENLEDTSAHAAAAILHGRIRSAYLTIRSYATAPSTPQHRVAAAKLCYLALTSRTEHDSYIPRPISSAERRLLFFDGGSRGNPGPGGAGAVIITMGGGAPSPAILWMASVSYATRTTNNVAEYQGLLVGLRYAARHQLYGLNVVGDSQLILTQLRKRRIPRSRHLQGRYEQCRMLADRLMVSSWTHHLRHFNKMADRLANIAMDLKKSIEITAADIPRLPPRWAPVTQALQGDVGHWLDNNPDMEGTRRPPTHFGAN